MDTVVIRILSVSSLDSIGKSHVGFRIHSYIFFKEVFLVNILEEEVQGVALGFFVEFEGIEIVAVDERFVFEQFFRNWVLTAILK